MLTLARQVRIPADSTVFDEDEPAERFWILRAGRVALDFHVPGHGLAVVETLGPGESCSAGRGRSNPSNVISELACARRYRPTSSTPRLFEA
jgi:CRP-like cAMP-binding protein